MCTMISGYVSSFSSIVTGGIETIFQYSGYWWFGNLEIIKRYYISVRYSLSPRTFVLAAAFVLRWVGRYLTLCLKISTYCIAHLIAPVIPPSLKPLICDPWFVSFYKNTDGHDQSKLLPFSKYLYTYMM